MIAILKKLLSSKAPIGQINFVESFMENGQHSWISAEPRLRRIFAEFLDSLPAAAKAYFSQNPLLILPANRKFSCSLDIPADHKVVLIFPDLMERLRSVYYEEALAVVAHELGHLFHQHSQQSIDPLEAQVAADSFAAELGYYQELVRIIEDEAQGVEARVRLVYLNSKYFYSKGNAIN